MKLQEEKKFEINENSKEIQSVKCSDFSKVELGKLAECIEKINKSKKSFFTFNKIVSILTILVLIFSFFSNFNFDFLKKESSIIENKLFKIERACDNENVVYFGKKDFMIYLTSKILKHKIISNNPDMYNLQEELNSNTDLNVILHGPPGTGKTAFIRKFSYYLNLKLKQHLAIQNFENKNSKNKFSCLSENKKTQLIRDVPNLVYIVFVDPASILNKFVGGSENKAKELFGLINQTKEHEIIIYFFDEVDAFCSNRDNDKQDYMIGIKNQLLSLLDGGCVDSKRNKKAFVFSATNRYNVIDHAFLRRFEVKAYFKLPETKEREYLVKKFLPSHSNIFTHEDIIEIAKLMHDYSHAEIRSCVLRFRIYFIGRKFLNKQILFDAMKRIILSLKPASLDSPEEIDYANDPSVIDHEIDEIDQNIFSDD